MKEVFNKQASIVIVNFNSAKNLKKLLTRLLTEKILEESEVIIVDNGEFLGEKRCSLRKLLPKEIVENFNLTIIRSKNVGFGAACNKGACLAKGENILFLNPDCLITGRSFDKLLIAFKNQHQIGILAPVLLEKDQKTPQKWSYAPKEDMWSRVFLKQNTAQKESSRKVIKYRANENRIVAQEQEKQNYQKAYWVSGACMLVKKNFFQKLGGFDRQFFMYFEDRDLCLRVNQEGYFVARLLNVGVVHLESKSVISWRKRKKIYYTYQDYFFKKHYGRIALRIMKFLRLPLYVKNIYFSRR